MRRVHTLLAGEKDTESQVVQLALALELRPDATLVNCLAKLHADEAGAAQREKLLDTSSASELLRRLRAHDGPSALAALERFEARQAEYRGILARFQQQMGEFTKGATENPPGPQGGALGNG